MFIILMLLSCGGNNLSKSKEKSLIESIRGYRYSVNGPETGVKEVEECIARESKKASKEEIAKVLFKKGDDYLLEKILSKEINKEYKDVILSYQDDEFYNLLVDNLIDDEKAKYCLENLRSGDQSKYSDAILLEAYLKYKNEEVKSIFFNGTKSYLEMTQPSYGASDSYIKQREPKKTFETIPNRDIKFFELAIDNRMYSSAAYILLAFGGGMDGFFGDSENDNKIDKSLGVSEGLKKLDEIIKFLDDNITASGSIAVKLDLSANKEQIAKAERISNENREKVKEYLPYLYNSQEQKDFQFNILLDVIMNPKKVSEYSMISYNLKGKIGKLELTQFEDNKINVLKNKIEKYMRAQVNLNQTVSG